MPTTTKKSRPHFGGLRHGYCENSECPTRNVFSASSGTAILTQSLSVHAASRR